MSKKDKAELHESEIRCLEQKARAHEAEAKLKELQVRAVQFAEDVKAVNDFRSGYFVFAEDVSQFSVDQFLGELRRFSRLYPEEAITIELYSPGGSIIDGFRLYDELVRLKNAGRHHLTIRVRGHAASMAVPVLQAADWRVVGANAWLMIHRAAFGAIGKAYEIEDQVEFVQRIERGIARIIAERSGQDIEWLVDLFKKRKDVWFDAEEAVHTYNLADEVG